MKAIWNGKIIAQSDKTINIEGNQYFPAEAVDKTFLSNSDTHTKCHWKGIASYFHVSVDGKTNKDAAWYYPDPSAQASQLKNYVAFWRGVEISN